MDQEIFTQVIATISCAVVDIIPDDKCVFLNKHLAPLGAFVYSDSDTSVFCITGTLDIINRCKDVIISLLLIDQDDSSGQKHTDALYDQKCSSQEIGITCDILKPKSYTSMKKRNRHQDHEVSGDDAGEPKEDSDDELEIEDTGKKWLLSRSGRIIKPSVKLQSSVIVKDIFNGPDLDFGDEKIRRKKRKPGRPRKVVQISKTERNVQPTVHCVNGDEQEIKSENLPSLLQETSLEVKINGTEMNVQNTEEQLTKHEKELENVSINKSLLKQKIGRIKEKENLSNIKKYYEDKMPYKYFCTECSYKSKRESHFHRHLELHTKNPGMQIYKCGKCDFTTIRQSVLQRHSVSHEVELLACPHCDYKTNNRKRFNLHFRKHKKSEYKCKICGSVFYHNHVLMEHLKTHGIGETNEAQRQVLQCTQCEYKTTRRLNLFRHVSNVHSDKRPFLCDTCGVAFKRMDNLQAHKLTHVERSKRKLPYVCVSCQKAFKCLAHLREHRAVHITVRSFQCHICGQLFKTKAVQVRHMQNIHFNPRSHVCSICKRIFASKYALKRHLQTHEVGYVQGKEMSVGINQSCVTDSVVKIEGHADIGQESVDENLSAIQTITMEQENLSEFSQEMPADSGQHSALDIGEVYIQGLDNVEADAVNIVNISSDDIQHIYIPTQEVTFTSEGDHVMPVASVVPNMIGLTKASKFKRHLADGTSSHIYLQDIPQGNIGSLISHTVVSQLCPEACSSSEMDVENKVSPGQEVLEFETVDEQNIVHQINQSEIILGQAHTGQIVELIAPDGQKYKIKVDGGQLFLNTSSN